LDLRRSTVSGICARASHKVTPDGSLRDAFSGAGLHQLFFTTATEGLHRRAAPREFPPGRCTGSTRTRPASRHCRFAATRLLA
jgi:hypothetical protein